MLFLPLLCVGTVNAADVVVRTACSTGENITLVMNDGATGRVRWGDGTYQTFRSTGVPLTFDVRDASMTIAVNKLRELRVSGCRLTALDVSAVSGTLEKLYCQNNLLEQLSLEGCRELQELNCANNRLTELAVESTVLEVVNTSGNPLMSLTLPRSYSLRSLACFDNQLDVVPVSESGGSLRSLLMSGDVTDSLDLSANTAIRTLVAEQCSLRHIAWNTQSSNTLASLQVAGNRLPFSSLPNIYNYTRKAYTVEANILPQSPFFLTGDIVAGEPQTWSEYLQKNGHGRSLAAEVVVTDAGGNTLVQGTDYTRSGTKYTFLSTFKGVTLNVTSRHYPDVTLVSEPFDVTQATGISSISRDEGLKINDEGVYDLQGRKVNGEKVKTNNAQLPRGIYIIDGKKIIKSR